MLDLVTQHCSQWQIQCVWGQLDTCSIKQQKSILKYKNNCKIQLFIYIQNYKYPVGK